MDERVTTHCEAMPLIPPGAAFEELPWVGRCHVAGRERDGQIKTLGNKEWFIPSAGGSKLNDHNNSEERNNPCHTLLSAGNILAQYSSACSPTPGAYVSFQIDDKIE
jgi:hypothetical protein